MIDVFSNVIISMVIHNGYHPTIKSLCVPQPFVQSVIPIASCLFILSETLRIPEDYKNLVLQNTGDEQTGDI